jgi:VWA domain-containing protein
VAHVPAYNRRMRSSILVCTALLVACKLKAANDPNDLKTDDVKKQIDKTIDHASEVEICPGSTLDELLHADSLTPECRNALLSFLPKPETTFKGSLFAPGGARAQGGNIEVMLQGADKDGAALTSDQLQQLEVSVVVNGKVQALKGADYAFAAAADLPKDLLSIAVVNDYSASMTNGDLDDLEAIERSFFECLPAVHETEVIRFSTTNERAVEFTSDAAKIQKALARDDGFKRETTALFDALGTSFDDLDARTRPVQLIVLATDGRENASKTWMKPEVLEALGSERNFIVVLGALLADVDLMRDLADTGGVFFYTREFRSLAASAEPYCDALANSVQLTLPADGVEQVKLHHAELDLDLEIKVSAD